MFWWSSHVTSKLISVWVSLCHIFIFTNLLQSWGVWLFDIWQIIGNSFNVFTECIQWITTHPQWATWWNFHYLLFSISVQPTEPLCGWLTEIPYTAPCRWSMRKYILKHKQITNTLDTKIILYLGFFPVYLRITLIFRDFPIESGS